MSLRVTMREISDEYLKKPRPTFAERIKRAVLPYKRRPHFDLQRDYNHLSNFDLSWVGRIDTMGNELGKYYSMVTARANKRKKDLKVLIDEVNYRTDEIIFTQKEVQRQISALSNEIHDSKPDFSRLNIYIKETVTGADYSKHLSFFFETLILEANAFAWRNYFKNILKTKDDNIKDVNTPYAKLIAPPSLGTRKSERTSFQPGSVISVGDAMTLLTLDRNINFALKHFAKFKKMSYEPTKLEVLPTTQK